MAAKPTPPQAEWIKTVCKQSESEIVQRLQATYLPGLQIGLIYQCHGRCDVDARQRRSLLKRHRVADLYTQVCRDGGVSVEAATCHKHDPVADADFFDAGAKFCHYAACFQPQLSNAVIQNAKGKQDIL